MIYIIGCAKNNFVLIIIGHIQKNENSKYSIK